MPPWSRAGPTRPSLRRPVGAKRGRMRQRLDTGLELDEGAELRDPGHPSVRTWPTS